MISEESCDTEGWSNDAENPALRHRICFLFKNLFKQKTVILNCNNIWQFLLYFYQMNAPWWARDFFQTH